MRDFVGSWRSAPGEFDFLGRQTVLEQICVSHDGFAEHAVLDRLSDEVVVGKSFLERLVFVEIGIGSP